jgi:hypothetical protein
LITNIVKGQQMGYDVGQEREDWETSAEVQKCGSAEGKVLKR